MVQNESKFMDLKWFLLIEFRKNLSIICAKIIVTNKLNHCSESAHNQIRTQ